MYINLGFIMKQVYILPGYEPLTKYNHLSKLFKKLSINAKIIKYPWDKIILTNYIKNFKKEYIAQDKIYILGFSFGAMAALISSIKLKPNLLIICSLSDYFSEDIALMNKMQLKEEEIALGKERINDFKKYKLNILLKQIRCKTIILAGKEEPKGIIKNSKKAKKLIKNSELIIIPKAKHNMFQKDYFNTLKTIISRLN